jgi:putative aminopeptidase FrvX
LAEFFNPEHRANYNLIENNRILTEDSLAFLKQYINNPSPTGFESGGQQMWLDYMKPWCDDYITDAYGSAAAIINPDALYKVVIEAHADEISWFVSYITDDGLLYLVRNGGSDHQIAPSKRVNIHTDKGIIKAVFGWPAIHTRGGNSKEKAPSPTNIFWIVVVLRRRRCLSAVFT